MNRSKCLYASLLGLLAVVTPGCAPKPRLAVAPELLSQEWRGVGAASEGAVVGSESLGAALGSTELQALIERALVANADIGAARARVAQARGQLRVARASMLPTVLGSGGISTTRTDDRTSSAFNFSDAFAGLDVSWDADLFGGARAARGAARSRLAAAGFDREAAALSVEAEVARAYVQHAVLGERVALLDRSIGSARKLERIVLVRLREGAATKVETGLQAIELRQLQAERHRLVEAQDATRNALAVLVGEEAPRFDAPDAALGALEPPALAPLQPGELLVRRPDIRAAEARIRAASGDVAEARAAFLPNLRLSANGLGQAAQLGGPYAATLSLGASLLAPIFDGGRLRGQLATTSAVQAESVELYRGALLGALAEAENALTAFEQSRARFALLDQVVEEARTTARLTQLQYIEGAADLRAVIDAQQLLVQVEDSRALSLQERLNAAIDLYRAMGGSPRAATRD